jgi:hypothetical protein
MYQWIDLGNGRQVLRKIETHTPKRSSLPCPMLSLDAMEPVQSQATGKIYDSKAALRAEYKQLGMVEVGNDPARLRKPKREKTPDYVIDRVVEKATARYARGERVKG